MVAERLIVYGCSKNRSNAVAHRRTPPSIYPLGSDRAVTRTRLR